LHGAEIEQHIALAQELAGIAGKLFSERQRCGYGFARASMSSRRRTLSPGRFATSAVISSRPTLFAPSPQKISVEPRRDRVAVDAAGLTAKILSQLQPAGLCERHASEKTVQRHQEQNGPLDHCQNASLPSWNRSGHKAARRASRFRAAG